MRLVLSETVRYVMSICPVKSAYPALTNVLTISKQLLPLHLFTMPLLTLIHQSSVWAD